MPKNPNLKELIERYINYHKKKKNYKPKVYKSLKYKKNNWRQNTGTNIQYFKRAGDISALPGAAGVGEIYFFSNANAVFPIPAFVNACRNWEQYKVLSVSVKYYAAFVGSESVTVPALPTATRFARGNVITWIEQPPLQPQPTAGKISILMGFPSAKLHQTRATIKRWMVRPSGGRYMDWAYINHPTALGVPNIDPDTWDSQIRIFGDNFGVQPPATRRPYFFFEETYKVIFRSKYRGGDP